VQRFVSPTPRLALGQKLLKVASAAIDISDGLLADLGHILERSAVGAELQVDWLPLSDALCEQVGQNEAQKLALSAGDDYELCFCVPVERAAKLELIAEQSGVTLSHIGVITEQTGLRVIDEAGQPVTSTQIGYQHF